MADFKYNGYNFNLTSYNEFVKEKNIENNQLANSYNLNKAVNQLKRELNQLIGQFKILTSKESIRWCADVVYDPGEIVSFLTSENPTNDEIKNSYYLAIPNVNENLGYYPNTNPEFWLKVTLNDLYPWLNLENYPAKTSNNSDWEVTDPYDVVNVRALEDRLVAFKEFLDGYSAGTYIKQDNEIDLTVKKPTHVTTKTYVDRLIEKANKQFLNLNKLLEDFVFVNKNTMQMQTRLSRINPIYTTDGGFLPGRRNVTNIGSNNEKFRSVYAQDFFGTALKAKYADLAEIYETDKIFKPGDILGINSEGIDYFNLNKHLEPLGVVSDKPGFVLNNDVKGVAIALKGQTPVKVKGSVKIGEILYANNGYATTIKNEFKIGLALESFSPKNPDEIGLVNTKI